MSVTASDSVGYSSLDGLLGHLRHRGVDVATFCRELGLPERAPENPDARVSLAVMGRAWVRAYALTGDAALALRVGAEATLSGLGIAGLVAAHAETVGEALESVGRYFVLVSGGLELSVTTDQSGGALRVINQGTSATEWRLVIERIFASAVAILRHETGGRGQPDRAEFSFAKPDHAAVYRELIVGDCRFGAECDALRFTREVLETSMAGRHARLQQVLTREAEQSLESLTSQPTLSQRLRTLVEELMGRGRCQASDAARALGMSERTLQRRLAEEDMTFQAVLDTVRHEQCLALLAARRLSMEQIAFACGFEEPSSFYRAFRRWTGKSPAQFRAPALIA